MTKYDNRAGTALETLKKAKTIFAENTKQKI